MNLIEGRSCDFCGAPAKNFYFSAFVCDSEECVNKAFDACGGPGGHKLVKDDESAEQ